MGAHNCAPSFCKIMSKNLAVMSRQTHAADGHPMTREELLALKNKRTLVTVFQISWIMVFVCLVVVCLHIRGNLATALPELTPVQFAIPLLATLAIIASGFTAGRAMGAIRKDDRAAFLSMWQLTIVLGGAFLAVMIAIFFYNPYLETGLYGQIFRVMIGYHAVHAVAIGWWLIQVFMNARHGAYSAENYWGVEAGARLWYFVIVAWVLFYIVLYLI